MSLKQRFRVHREALSEPTHMTENQCQDDIWTKELSEPMHMQSTKKNPGHLQASGMTNLNSESQYEQLHGARYLRNMETAQAVKMNSGPSKQVPFGMLLPVIKSKLDKDRSMQLDSLHLQLKQKTISKEEFILHLKDLVGDHMIKMAVYQLPQWQAAQRLRDAPDQSHLSALDSARINIAKPSSKSSDVPPSAAQVSNHLINIAMNNDAQKSHMVGYQSDLDGMKVNQISSSNPHAGFQESEHPYPIQKLGKQQQCLKFSRDCFPDLGTAGGYELPYSGTHVSQVSDSSISIALDIDTQKSHMVEYQSDSHGLQVNQISSSKIQEREHPFPIKELTKQQQQHLHLSEACFANCGSTGGSELQFSGTRNNILAQTPKQQLNDLPMRQPVHSSMLETVFTTRTSSQIIAVNNGRPNSFSDSKGVKGELSTSQQPSTHPDEIPPSSSLEAKQEAIYQRDQRLKEQFSRPQQFSALCEGRIEKGIVIPGNSRHEDLKMQSSKMGFSTSFTSVAAQMEPHNLSSSCIPSPTASLRPGSDLNTPSEKPRIGPRRPLEGLRSLAPPLSKKRKVSGTLSDVKIEQLNDVSFVSGVNLRSNSCIPSPTASLRPGSDPNTPSEKPRIGPKRPLEGLRSLAPPLSKKRKVSGTLSDVKIDQLNDVSFVAGVNLREEEEQLFYGSKENSRASEAFKFVREEEKSILEKNPLQKKLKEIMAKCGVNGRSNDVDRCLALCVEARMRGLITSLIRISKKRVDLERASYQTVITSDINQVIQGTNQKTCKDSENKSSDAEKLQRVDEPEGSAGVDDNGSCGNSSKANKEVQDQLTKAANLAARAAVGGDDVLSKWKLMSGQAREKQGVIDATPSIQPTIDMGESVFVRNARASSDAEERSSRAAIALDGSMKESRRNQGSYHKGEGRCISVKDVASVLERELQMSRSTLIYSLYEKMNSRAMTC